MNRAKKKLSAFDIVMIVVAILAIALIIAGACLLKSCLSRSRFDEEVVIGDFVCQEWGVNEIHIKDLSEEGKKKRNIIIPKELNGRKVVKLGYVAGYFAPNAGRIESDKLERLFILPDDLSVSNGVMTRCINLKKIVLINCTPADIYNIRNNTNAICFMTYKRYIEEYDDYGNIELGEIPRRYAANVSYYYNYEGSENDGYYWIDDIENGEKIEVIPEEPKREGYKFGGWYKEQECINKWDFAKDTVEKVKVDRTNYTEFVENKLYAKWMKD